MNGQDDGEFFRLEREAFASSPSDSIDYAVMEQLANDRSVCTGAVVPLQRGLVGRGLVGRDLEDQPPRTAKKTSRADA